MQADVCSPFAARGHHCSLPHVAKLPSRRTHSDRPHSLPPPLPPLSKLLIHDPPSDLKIPFWTSVAPARRRARRAPCVQYASHHELGPSLRLRTTVLSVRRQPDGAWRVRWTKRPRGDEDGGGGGEQAGTVEAATATATATVAGSGEAGDGEEVEELFSAVLVANGHFHAPVIPRLAGRDEFERAGGAQSKPDASHAHTRTHAWRTHVAAARSTGHRACARPQRADADALAFERCGCATF
eukprot:1153416-Pleurochrysis_carterae.AAC.4